MKQERVIHAYIDCMLCNKVITQYLDEPKEFETLYIDADSSIDACCSCAESYYAKLRDDEVLSDVQSGD